jgi:hypothetical protein
MKAVARAASKAGGLTGSLIFACCDAINLAVQQPRLLRFSQRWRAHRVLRSATLLRNYTDKLANMNRAGTRSYFTLFNVSKILPFIRRAISAAGRGFWHSDNGLSQKLELGNISNRLRAAAPRQVSGSFT